MQMVTNFLLFGFFATLLILGYNLYQDRIKPFVERAADLFDRLAAAVEPWLAAVSGFYVSYIEPVAAAAAGFYGDHLAQPVSAVADLLMLGALAPFIAAFVVLAFFRGLDRAVLLADGASHGAPGVLSTILGASLGCAFWIAAMAVFGTIVALSDTLLHGARFLGGVMLVLQAFIVLVTKSSMPGWEGASPSTGNRFARGLATSLASPGPMPIFLALFIPYTVPYGAAEPERFAMATGAWLCALCVAANLLLGFASGTVRSLDREGPFGVPRSRWILSIAMLGLGLAFFNA